MGTVYEANCPECGYQKKFHIGSGLFALQLHRHLQYFDEKEQAAIQQMEQEKKMQRFQILNQLGLCEQCKTLQEKTLLFVTAINQEEYLFGNHCADCRSALALYEEQEMEHIICPDCGKKELEFLKIGQWD